MLTITESAERKIAELVAKSENPVKGLRIGARVRSPFKVDYKMAFIGDEQESPEDTILNFDGFDVYMDAESNEALEKATVDYVEGEMGSGFKIDRPSELPEHLSGTMVEKVQQVIEQNINPAVAGHGGRIALIDIRDNVVFVELQGGCQGCGMANVTLKQGVEKAIMAAVPEITEVLDVTEHAGGKNPYYQSEAAE